MGFPLNHPAIQTAIAKGLFAPEKMPQNRKQREAQILTGVPTSWVAILRPACRVVSEANRTGHWTARKRRFDTQKAAVVEAWSRAPFLLYDMGGWAAVMPVMVTLTHFGPTMDDDNLNSAFKGVRDQVAALMCVDDGDERVKWVYQQEAGEPGIEIRIANGGLK